MVHVYKVLLNIVSKGLTLFIGRCVFLNPSQFLFGVRSIGSILEFTSTISALVLIGTHLLPGDKKQFIHVFKDLLPNMPKTTSVTKGVQTHTVMIQPSDMICNIKTTTCVQSCFFLSQFKQVPLLNQANIQEFQGCELLLTKKV